MKTLVSNRRLATGAAVVTLLLSTPLSSLAQQDRAGLVERGIDAYLGFEPDTAIAYFRAAVDPNIGPPDETWALGLQFLVQTLLEEGDSETANVWMRWAVRHFGEMRIDSAEFDDPELLANTYFAAMGFVGTLSPQDSATTTRWEWPLLRGAGDRGTLRVDQTGLAADVSVNVPGYGTLAQGRILTLPPGSYTLEAAAPGYEGASVMREVIPGVTSVLSFDLMAVEVEQAALALDILPPDVELAVRNQLVRFNAMRFGGEPTCGTGFFAGGDGLLLTTYTAVRGAETIHVQMPDGERLTTNVEFAAWDVDRNVAVLKLPIERSDSLRLSTAVSDDQWTWVFAHPDCGSAELSPNRVAEWLNRPVGGLLLTDSILFGEQGGPLINQSGAVIGLAAGPLTAVPADHVNRSVQLARENVVEDRLTALTEVARRENHLYGSVTIQSSLADAIATVTPLEEWHWQESTGGPVPLTFTGPMGRYRLDLRAVGEAQHTAEFAIEPGVLKEIAEPQIVAESGGGFPWPIALIGVAGAAVAGVLALGGGDDGGGTGNGNGNGTEPTTITVIVPQIR
jgi:hypothetical protein